MTDHQQETAAAFATHDATAPFGVDVSRETSDAADARQARLNRIAAPVAYITGAAAVAMFIIAIITTLTHSS